MIDPRTAMLLQEIVRREGRSVLVYVGDAFPWASVRDVAILGRVNDLIRAETQAIGDIGKLLQRRRTPLTFHGSYPSSFTTINFLSLKHILPRLAAYELASIPILENDLAHVKDPEAKAVVEKLLAVKRANLASLDDLAAPRPQPAA